MRAPHRAEALRALALALVAGAAAARAAEPPPASGGALRISVEPPRLVAGSDAGARVRIATGSAIEDLDVTASAGRIEDLRPDPAGGYTARYVLPAERWPRVAIVAALARGPGGIVDGWAAIPVSARGDARVHARPGVSVTLRIGDALFGPVRANAQGLAIVPVVVPPGVREGHQGFHPVDLRVPETSLVHATLERTVVRADEGGELRIFAYVVAPHGAARRGDVPVLEATRGEVRVQPREPGAFVGTWRLPPGPAGVERVFVRLPGAAASRTVVATEVVPGPPATVALAFDQERVVAGEADEVAVTARVLDAAGNPTASPLDLESDVGAVGPVAERAPGVFEARVRIPPAFEGRSEAVVTARVPGAGIAGSRALPLVPAAPAAARLEAARTVVLADGRREAALRLVVRDRFDNPVARLEPAVSGGGGRVVAVTADGPGEYVVRYLPRAVERRTEERIDAEVAGVRARADLVLLPSERAIAVAPDAGVAIAANGRFAAPRAGVAAELPLDVLVPVALAARVEAGVLGYRWSEAPPHKNADARGVSALATTVLAGATARLERWPGVEVWGSGALGVAIGRTDPSDAAAESGVAPAGRLSAGIGWRAPFGVPFLELGLLAAGRTTPDLGAFAAITAGLGVRFEWRAGSSPAPAGS